MMDDLLLKCRAQEADEVTFEDNEHGSIAIMIREGLLGTFASVILEPEDSHRLNNWLVEYLRTTPITLPARTETLPTGDAFATERANGRNQALKECAAMLKAQGFKVVGYE